LPGELAFTHSVVDAPDTVTFADLTLLIESTQFEPEGTPTLRFNGDFKPEFRAKNDGKDEAKLAVKPRRDMVGNFLDAVRGTDRLNCNVELGTATMVAIKLAVESYRQKKTMVWDPKAERVVG